MGGRGGGSPQPEFQSFGQWASVSVHLTAAPTLQELHLVPIDNSSNFLQIVSTTPSGAGSRNLRPGKTRKLAE